MMAKFVGAHTRVVLGVVFIFSLVFGLAFWRSQQVWGSAIWSSDVSSSSFSWRLSEPESQLKLEVQTQELQTQEQERPDATAVFTNPTAITIPAVGNGSLYPSPIMVSGLSGPIPNTAGSVKVTINSFSHTFPNDVGILLVGPNGNLLLQNAVTDGNAQVASNVVYTISDDGATALPNSTALTAGTFKPATYRSGDSFPSPGPLLAYNSPGPTPAGAATLTSVFGNTNPNGTWNLFVVDFATGDMGSISGGWTLTLTVPGPLEVTKVADTNDGACTLFDCSLREAIALVLEANRAPWEEELAGTDVIRRRSAREAN